MKKFILGLAVLAMAFLGSCNSCSSDKEAKQDTTDTPAVVTNLNVLTLATADYNSTVADCGLAEKDVHYFEGQVWLDKEVTSEEAPEAVKVVNVIATPDTVYTYKHEIDSTGVQTDSMQKVAGFWCEDVVIDLNAICVPLDSAITLMRAYDGIVPPTKCVTLRRPLGPQLTNPLYIFGTAVGKKTTNFVAVDAVTGKYVEKW